MSEKKLHPASCSPIESKMAPHPEAGVSLIEMMVVLVIIAVITAVVVPNVIDRPDEARVTVAKNDLRAISSTLEIYRLDNQTYPTTAQGLDALVRRATTPPLPRRFPEQGYLPVRPVDPWGNDYIYTSPGSQRPFEITSLGADGRVGGTGVNADIANVETIAAR